MAATPPGTTAMTFEAASAAVVSYLKQAVPLGYWSVSRYDGDRQLYLTVEDDSYGAQAGDSHLWADSLCRLVMSDGAPSIAPDAMAVPAYASAPISQAIEIGAYIGIPITRPNGELFGTLCGLDPTVQENALLEHRSLLELLSALLSSVLDADLVRADADRELQRLALAAESDSLTGLYNRRGWERFLAMEESRHHRFGDPGSVIILDLDGLKPINDLLGHATGDEYLKRAAETLRQNVRETDIVARLGGDEFGVLAIDTTVEQSDDLLLRLRESLAAADVPGSFGCSHYASNRSLAAVWAAADRAMYEEKTRRR